jgi:DMSO/TMAO reductase YedYZ molybdopterin-dependent catalytic subunit
MAPISRGFGGRRRDDVDPSRIPPGQYYERGFPVLSAGPTPRTPLEEWTFSIQHAVDEARAWTWDEFTALPAEDVTVDIHCVTNWSKLDTRWKGVSVDALLDGVETEADWVTAFADGDYTTNMGLEDVTDGRAWIAYEYDGAPLDPEHGGPPLVLVPHLPMTVTVTARRRAATARAYAYPKCVRSRPYCARACSTRPGDQPRGRPARMACGAHASSTCRQRPGRGQPAVHRQPTNGGQPFAT